MGTSAGFVGRERELRILDERLAIAGTGHPQVVFVEGEPGAGKTTLLTRFLGSHSEAMVLVAGGDETETLLSYGIIDQLQIGVVTEPGTDPMAAGVQLLDLFDRLQAGVLQTGGSSAFTPAASVREVAETLRGARSGA